MGMARLGIRSRSLVVVFYGAPISHRVGKAQIDCSVQMFRHVLNKLGCWVFSPITQVWESKLEKCQVNSMVYTHLCFGRLCARYLLFISD
jgi:hypothetical protein